MEKKESSYFALNNSKIKVYMCKWDFCDKNSYVSVFLMEVA